MAQQPDISGASTASLFEAFLSEEPLTCLVPSRQTKDFLKEERNLTPLTEEGSTLPVTKALCTSIFFLNYRICTEMVVEGNSQDLRARIP